MEERLLTGLGWLAEVVGWLALLPNPPLPRLQVSGGWLKVLGGWLYSPPPQPLPCNSVETRLLAVHLVGSCTFTWSAAARVHADQAACRAPGQLLHMDSNDKACSDASPPLSRHVLEAH
eukprot:352248-Chlamydomonas_euryale.AAC.3